MVMTRARIPSISQSSQARLYCRMIEDRSFDRHRFHLFQVNNAMLVLVNETAKRFSISNRENRTRDKYSKCATNMSDLTFPGPLPRSLILQGLRHSVLLVVRVRKFIREREGCWTTSVKLIIHHVGKNPAALPGTSERKWLPSKCSGYSGVSTQDS